ncbi:MAG: Copper resistance protein CopC [Streptosporangiaceae bacterium]|jgi:methionine-rich copper-binding protein CopC|nr:Copper resistance protein CopC [Streptosporangiaceae bacterium]
MTTTLRVRLRRLGVVAAITMACAAVFAAPASAHTKLLKSTPATDSSVKELTQVTLVFSEPVKGSLAKVRIRDAAGAEHAAAEPPQVKGDTVTQPAAGDLQPGDYTIAYRVVSADGHPVSGEVPFKLTGLAPGEQAGVATAAAAPNDPVAKVNGPVAPSHKSSSAGGMKWMGIGVGLLIGIIIGAGIFLMRKRGSDPAAPSGE